MPLLSRRSVLTRLAGLAALGCLPQAARANRIDNTQCCTLGFGTYGLPGMAIHEALKRVAQAGYDSVEVTVTADRDTAPENLTAAQRKELRGDIDIHGLQLPSLMEHLQPLGDASRHQADTDRLRRAAELAHDLNPARPPLVQTVLGGRDWEAVRALCRDRLADWLEVAESTKTVVCIKPHRGSAMSRPEDALWVIDQLGNSPWLRMVYDYSHFALRDMPLEQTITTSLPITAHIAVKDVVMRDGKTQFALPGESSTIDYAALLKQFFEGGYRGDVCVEVSGQVWGQPDYDPQHALAFCYQHLSAAFEQAGVSRPRR